MDVIEAEDHNYLATYSKYPESWYPGCPNTNFIAISSNAIVTKERMAIELARALGKYFGILPSDNIYGFSTENCNLSTPTDDPALTGDLISDTPFEPTHSTCIPPAGCSDFTCSITCPVSQTTYSYTFDPGNIMSRYYLNCPTPHFTVGQLDRMCFFLFRDRNYLLTPEALKPGPFGEKGRITRLCGVGADQEEPVPFRKVKFYFDQSSQSNFGDDWDSRPPEAYYYHYGIFSNDHQEVTLKPDKGGDPRNGVNVDDINLLRGYLLFGFPLSPFQMIAGDVNYSGNLTDKDIIIIRKIILGELFEFGPTVREWRYIPKAAFVTDPVFEADFYDGDPFDAIWVDPEGVERQYFVSTTPGLPDQSFMDQVHIKYDNPGYNLIADDTWSFYVIKSGDLDCSAMPNETIDNGNGGAPPAIITSPHTTFLTGDYIDLTVIGSADSDIDAYQFSLNFDSTKIELINVEAGDLPYFSFDNFNFSQFSSGKFRTLWYNPVSSTPYNLSAPKTLFKLKLRAISDISNIGSLVSLGTGINNLFFYNQASIGAQITLQASVSLTNTNKLTSIYPSPVSNSVTFNVNLYQPAQISLVLTDQFGHTVNSQQTLSIGDQSVTIQNLQTLANGIIFYSVTIGNQIFSGTLIKNTE